MRKMIAVRVGLVVMLTMCVGAVAAFRCCQPSPRTKVANVQEKIARELPIGSKKQDVATWLNYYSLAIQEYHDETGQTFIRSWIMNSGPPSELPFGIRDIRILFHFDSNETLLKVTVKEEERF